MSAPGTLEQVLTSGDALRDSEARYRILVEQAPDAIISANNAGDIISWNAGAEKVFGYASLLNTGIHPSSP